MTNFERFPDYGFVYTEKEQSMHVIGPKETVEAIDFPIDCDPIKDINLFNFLKDGYYCVESLIDNQLILEARKYINSNYISWLKQTKRQDDWRCHYQLNFSTLNNENPVEHLPILNLLIKSPKLINQLTYLMNTTPIGIFYTQIAYRTPYKSSRPIEYLPGAEYHIDGNANQMGVRFPDPWTVMIGIALVDIITDQKGNFTLFPGGHTSHSWLNYSHEKQTKTLPSLSPIVKVCLHAGDVIFIHPLLPHRGGKNDLIPDNILNIEINEFPNIPINTREMIFIRIQGKNIDYYDPNRSVNVLTDPWLDFKHLQERFQSFSIIEDLNSH